MEPRDLIITRVFMFLTGGVYHMKDDGLTYTAGIFRGPVNKLFKYEEYLERHKSEMNLLVKSVHFLLHWTFIVFLLLLHCWWHFMLFVCSQLDSLLWVIRKIAVYILQCLYLKR